MTDIEKQELEYLTERYYAGETSKSEETRMRVLLSEASADHRYETDAAVAGFFAAQRQQRSDKSFRIRRSFRTAAMLAISLAAGAALFFSIQTSGENECVAYINGAEATDSDAAITIMMAQIQEIAPATKTANEEMINMINDFTLSIQ